MIISLLFLALYEITW